MKKSRRTSTLLTALLALHVHRAAASLILGADPTGKVSSTAAFQAAVDEHDSIEVPSGHYRFTEAVRLRSHSKIFALPGTAVLVADAGNSARSGGLIFVGVGLHNVSVIGVSFDGNSIVNQDNHRRLVFIEGADNVLFDRDKFYNSAGPALVFSAAGNESVTNSGVRRSSFSAIGMGWAGRRDARLRDAASALIFSNGDARENTHNFADGNSFEQIGADAVDIHSQSQFEASYNHLELNELGWRPTRRTAVSFGVGGFYVHHGSNEVSLTRNNVNGATGNCFDIADTSDLVVTDNSVENCGGAGISLANVTNFVVSKNIFLRTDKSLRYEVENLTHKGVITFGCGMDGCKGFALNGTISHNILEHYNNTATKTLGIWIQSGVTDSNVVLIGNQSTSGSAVALTRQH